MCPITPLLPSVWSGPGGVSTTPLAGGGYRRRSVMKHSRTPSHPGADPPEPLSRLSPTIWRGWVISQERPRGCRVDHPPCRPWRCGSNLRHCNWAGMGGRYGSPAGVRWGTCASITACCVSAAGRMHRPMAIVAGHSLRAAHDPPDSTDSSVNASSRVESYNPSSTGRRIAPPCMPVC
jgi:hypothetical protein